MFANRQAYVVRVALHSGHERAASPLPRSADTVAKVFSTSGRATL